MPAASWSFALALLILPSAVTAQSVPRPAPSMLWSAAPADHAERTASMHRSISRSEGFALGAVVGGLAAGFLGHRACKAYSALGDCGGAALWWAVVGGTVGGLIGASGGDDRGVPPRE